MQHAEFPSCLRFSFTRNKLEKSRNPAPLRAHVSATIGTETVATLVKVRRMQLCAFSECGRETHASTTQSDPLLLPTRNGPCRKDEALNWGYLFCRVQHPPP